MRKDNHGVKNLPHECVLWLNKPLNINILNYARKGLLLHNQYKYIKNVKIF